MIILQMPDDSYVEVVELWNGMCAIADDQSMMIVDETGHNSKIIRTCTTLIGLEENIEWLHNE